MCRDVLYLPHYETLVRVFLVKKSFDKYHLFDFKPLPQLKDAPLSIIQQSDHTHSGKATATTDWQFNWHSIPMHSQKTARFDIHTQEKLQSGLTTIVDYQGNNSAWLMVQTTIMPIRESSLSIMRSSYIDHLPLVWTYRGLRSMYYSGLSLGTVT